MQTEQTVKASDRVSVRTVRIEGTVNRGGQIVPSKIETRPPPPAPTKPAGTAQQSS